MVQWAELLGADFLREVLPEARGTRPGHCPTATGSLGLENEVPLWSLG